jgi:prepilin-type processing-associated H-X9-DG protein
VNDHGYYPTFGEEVMENGRMVERSWQHWFREYMTGDRDVLFCPANEEKFRWITETPEGVTYPEEFSYGLNAFGSGLSSQYGLGAAPPSATLMPTYIREADVLFPSQMIAFTDSNSDSQAANLVVPTFGVPGPRGFDSWAPSKRHNGGANVLFCDGHVEHVKYKDLVEHRDEVMRRWNNDNAPHPETWMMNLSAR